MSSLARVNGGFELVASMRQMNLAPAKRSIESSMAVASKELVVDDRRKLALTAAAAASIAGKLDATKDKVVRKYFTPSEIQELAGILQETATSNAELGVALAMAAQEYIPPYHTGFGFWDYFSINLYKCERNGDAYLIWNRAVTATPPTNNPQDSKTTKAIDKKQPAATAAAAYTGAPAKDTAGPVGNNDAPAPPATKEKEQAKEKELPLRPRVRAGRGNKEETVNDAATAAELPLRPRVRGGKRDEAPKEAVEKAAANNTEDSKDTPASVETFVRSDHGNLGHIRNNMGFALQKLRCPAIKADSLPTLESIVGGLLHKTSWTSQTIPNKFHAFNPSIIPHPTDSGKFLVNLRAGNYFMNANHRYEFPPGMPGITTLNFLTTMEQDYRGSEFSDTKQIKAPPMPNPYPDICGLEDLRLLWEPQSKKLYASFTSLEVTPEHRPQVCLMQLDPRKGRIIGNPVRLHGFDSDKTQKNWIGFADAGKLYFIYSLQPITVVQANPKTGEVRVVSVDATPVINEWRGSSPLVELSRDLVDQLPGGTGQDKGAEHLESEKWFVALVHISHFPRYHHQFIVLKKTATPHSEFRPFSLQITHQSPPFVFEKHDVEFSCGMALTNDHSEIVIPYSKRDNDCTCVRIATTSLFQNMHPIPQIANFKLRSQ